MAAAKTIEIVRLLRSAADAAIVHAVELDTISVLSLLGEASTSVNCMLLHQFLNDEGLTRRHHVSRASRVPTAYGPLVLLVLEYEDGEHRSQLVYAEFAGARLSAAFVGEDVAFIRNARVVTCPFTALDERVLARTSLHVARDFDGRGHRHHAFPPVA